MWPQENSSEASEKSTAAFSEAERNAMRAFLQRTEVRYSTLHRVATAFVGGAGLLLLTPIFFKEVVDNIMLVLLRNMSNQFPGLDPQLGILLTLTLFATVLYPLALSLLIPLYALYLLLKDIVQFYFTLYAPGFSEDLLHPTFSLSGLAFSPDESPRAKAEIMRYQYADPARMRFMMPFSPAKRALYFDTIVETTQGRIIPPTRHYDDLKAAGVLTETAQKQQVEQFGASMGLARTLDRDLIEEVAIQEMALVRSVTYIRRLVMRYVKALLMFIWTTLIAFIMLPLLQDSPLPPFIVLSAGYLLWALLVLTLIRVPLKWVYRHRQEAPPTDQVDAQLTMMEQTVKPYCYAAILSSAIGLMLSLASSLI